MVCKLFKGLGVIQFLRDRSCSYFPIVTLAMNLFYFQMGPPYMREVQSPSHHHSDTQSRTPRHEPWTRNQLYYLVTLLKSHNVDHGSHEMDHGILQSTLKTANKPFLGKWAAEQQELGLLQLQSPLLFPLFFPGSRDLSSPQWPSCPVMVHGVKHDVVTCIKPPKKDVMKSHVIAELCLHYPQPRD